MALKFMELCLRILSNDTIATNLDIFAIGSKMLIDLLKVDSVDGDCTIILCNKIMIQDIFMNGIKDGNNHDVQIYSIMCCCDWCPKLYGCEEKLHELMKEFSMGMKWPGLIQESMETQAVTAVEVTVI
ncbi:hypothetical protein ACHAXS_001126 [Conticribra weissflogii]